MEIDSAFYSLSAAVRLLQVTENTNYSDLHKTLQAFEKALQKLDASLLPIFLSVHKEELTRISRALRKWSSTDSMLRAFDDRIFKKYFQFKKVIPSALTSLFQEFIKGITYFEYQTGTEVPIYHRLFACGPGDNAFRKEYQICSKDTDPHRMEDIKRRIETCYIERIVYDAMYKDYTLFFPQRGDCQHQQDSNHRHRLEVTKQDFLSCFPALDITVNLIWDMDMPVRLTVTRSINNLVQSVEIYTRTISPIQKVYNPEVECIRQTKHKKYFRVQRFDDLRKWVEI